jgi:hypothetical protein
MATVTTLDREILREERCVGIPTDQPLTDIAIAHRRVQIAAVLGGCGFVVIFAALFAGGIVRASVIALAIGFGAYAIEKERHLRRLASLRDDSERISLVVAGELMFSGALTGDRELLDLRAGFGRAAGRLAAGLADVVSADATRVRLVGPSGEVPVAAERELAARRPVLDDPGPARAALQARKPVRVTTTEGRGVLVVPLWRGGEMVGLLEAVSAPGHKFGPSDAVRADAYARGAIAALLTMQ